MFLLNTFLGFLIVQISDILTRSKGSLNSPKKFDPVFFIKDTWLKIVLSLFLSFAISGAAYLNFDDAILLSGLADYHGLIYVVIGAVPEFVLQKLKKKLGIAQPQKVTTKGETFNRA